MTQPGEDIHFSAETLDRMRDVLVTYIIKRASYVNGLRTQQISQIQFARFCNDHAQMLGAVMPLMSLRAMKLFRGSVVRAGQSGFADYAEREALEELLGCLIGLREMAG